MSTDFFYNSLVSLVIYGFGSNSPSVKHHDKLGADYQAPYLVTVYSHIILSYNAIFKGYKGKFDNKKKNVKKSQKHRKPLARPCLPF